MDIERVAIPDILAQPRDHAIICTFGADLTFYEGPLWRQIARARHRVVLADDMMLASQMNDLAANGGRLRHVNINYLAAPVTNPGRAHAKFILLADAAGGTLLVGSGNVSIDGYASRGEVFCRYDVNDRDTGQLAAFRAVKDLLGIMAARGYLDTQAQNHLAHVWSGTPWIWATPPGDAAPVRHNLDTPLATQLADAISGESVLDLVAHAPFHDRSCEALGRLLRTLSPANVTVLVQEGSTSVDPHALDLVLREYGSPARVLLAAAPEFPGTYLHAKFILVRTATRTITLTGSANLSLAALYRTDRPAGGQPAGNIELVNVLDGPAGIFDEFLSGLNLTESATPTAALNVSLAGDSSRPDTAQPQLQSAVWENGVLGIESAAPLPPGSLTLMIAGNDAPAEITVEDRTITARPASEAADLLDRTAVLVRLRIDTADSPVETTPVYPYHLRSLASMLTDRRDPDLLRKTGSLDLGTDDEDLTALVYELDAALVISPQSLWRLAGRTGPTEASDGEGPRLSWDDIDFETLRHHPKLAQYQSSLGSGAGRLEVTDLQIILAAITERFQSLGQHATSGRQSPGNSPGADLDDMLTTLPGDRDDGPGDKTPEEAEAESESEDEEERQRHRLRIETRNRLAWQRFCDRFTRGLRDPEFIDLVGHDVAITNAIIFNHLLALLVARHIIDPGNGITRQLQLWEFLWGSADRSGYLDALDDDTRLAAMEAIAARGGEVTVIAAVSVADQLTLSNDWHDLRTELREVWRHLLASPLLTFTSEVISLAAALSSRSAADIARGLDQLARELAPRELQAALAMHLGTTDARVRARRSIIQGRHREVLLADDPNARLDPEAASAALATWATMEPSREYLRIEQPTSGISAVWDRLNHICWLYDRNAGGEPVTLQEPTPAEPAWAAESRRVLAAALKADQTAA